MFWGARGMQLGGSGPLNRQTCSTLAQSPLTLRVSQALRRWVCPRTPHPPPPHPRTPPRSTFAPRTVHSPTPSLFEGAPTEGLAQERPDAVLTRSGTTNTQCADAGPRRVRNAHGQAHNAPPPPPENESTGPSPVCNAPPKTFDSPRSALPWPCSAAPPALCPGPSHTPALPVPQSFHSAEAQLIFQE